MIPAIRLHNAAINAAGKERLTYSSFFIVLVGGYASCFNSLLLTCCFGDRQAVPLVSKQQIGVEPALWYLAGKSAISKKYRLNELSPTQINCLF